MSLRILLIFPEKINEAAKAKISSDYGYPMIRTVNKYLNTYLHDTETAYQLYQDSIDFTGIGTQTVLNNYYNNKSEIEKIIGGSEALSMLRNEIAFYHNDVKHWISFMQDMICNMNFKYIGIMCFMAYDKTDNCKFENISRQEYCLSELNEKILLNLEDNTILIVKEKKVNADSTQILQTGDVNLV